MIVATIDPGATGALVASELSERVPKGEPLYSYGLLAAHLAETYHDGGRILPGRLGLLLSEIGPDLIVIEKAELRTSQGLSSSALAWLNVGIILGVSVPIAEVREVSSKVWQSRLSLERASTIQAAREIKSRHRSLSPIKAESVAIAIAHTHATGAVSPHEHLTGKKRPRDGLADAIGILISTAKTLNL